MANAPRPGARRAFRERTRRPGLPGWGLALLLAGAGTVAALVLVLAVRQASSRAESPSAPSGLETAQRLFRDGELEAAAGRLERIDEGELGPSRREELATLRAAVAERVAEEERERENLGGDARHEMLVAYERSHLQGVPEPKKVRVFLKRARDFRERWPEHPGVDWVRRQESRFEGHVDLEAPPGWEEVDWEVKCLVRSSPRNYAGALDLVEEFLGRAGGLEAELAKRLRRILLRERDEYHASQIEAAREDWEAGRTGEAVWKLVHQVIWSGDPELADRAARILARMPDVDRHLEGYRRRYPDKYAEIRNRVPRRQ